MVPTVYSALSPVLSAYEASEVNAAAEAGIPNQARSDGLSTPFSETKQGNDKRSRVAHSRLRCGAFLMG